LEKLWQLEYDGKDPLTYTGIFKSKVRACAKYKKNFSDYQKLTIFLLLCKKAALNWVRRKKSIIRMIPAAGLNLVMDYFIDKFRYRVKYNQSFDDGGKPGKTGNLYNSNTGDIRGNGKSGSRSRGGGRGGRSNGPNKGPSGSSCNNVLCWKCGKKGHISRKCPKIIDGGESMLTHAKITSQNRYQACLIRITERSLPFLTQRISTSLWQNTKIL
jgi:hypothetical protein